ncbi:thiamine phosphate synthase [Marinococcus luteus]|uniref:thiamine phosphate synthase n=1 Tax=Marinococcus luteus TaxID=1122204 RepID=UPI002ACC4180|nr:thiamine phosphate synthase [Marinococcus luteus]MDZ5784317.1 thiamine phosphate synthase [Marinococcus luteus]
MDHKPRLCIHAVSPPDIPVAAWWEKTKELTGIIDYVHIRAPEWTKREKETAIDLALKEGTAPEQLIINDEPELAAAYGLAGTHLPERRTIYPASVSWGQSIHSVEAAKKSEQEGASWLYFGHVFASDSKPGKPPNGARALKAVAESVRLPVIAIGGIDADKAAECINCRAAGVAAIAYFYDAAEPRKAAEELRTRLRSDDNEG